MAAKVKQDKQNFKSGKAKSRYNPYQRRNPQGLFSTFAHHADEYANQEDMERAERAAHKAKIKSGAFGIKTKVKRPFQEDK